MSLARRPHEIVLWVLHIKWFLWIITRTHRHTNQDEKWFMHASASCFTLGCRWNEPFHEIMVPLTHATSEGSDEPAHPHSLARGINAHIPGCRCRCKSKAFLPNSARNFFVCKQQMRRSARAPAQFYQLSLESMIAKPATCKKIKFLSDMRARIQTIPTGGGVELLLEGGSYQFFF